MKTFGIALLAVFRVAEQSKLLSKRKVSVFTFDF
jgi:hypothetical protein